MKTLLKFSIILIVSCLSFTLTAQPQIQRTYHASFSPQESNTLFLDLKGPVEMETWEKNHILLYVTVNANTSNERIIDYLKILADTTCRKVSV